MRGAYRRLKQLFESRLGQELPGWAFVLALIIGLFALGFLVWLAVKGGRASVEQIGGLR